MDEVVLCEIGEDGVALLTLNRPHRLNAWTHEMQVKLFDHLAACAGDERVRVIVVTGAGRGFCPGADMDNLGALSARAGAGAHAPDAGEQVGSGGRGRGRENGGGGAGAVMADTREITFALSVPKPIVAAINGACAGIGLAVALTCDVRFCAAEAKLTTVFARRGLIAEHSMSWILPRLVGPARALDLLLSARVVRGREAAELGLVNVAVEDERVLEVALDYARDLAANVSPASIATIKRQVYADLERTLPDALSAANALMLESFTKPDFAEGVSSFVEKRPPRFAAVSASLP